MPGPALTDAPDADLDLSAHLPPANRRSYFHLMWVQALNAFNDNFVKMLLVVFAGAAAKGTDLGGSIQIYLGAIFPLPYIFLAPVAGWMSDRFSKQRVLIWMQVIQMLIFGLFIGAMFLHNVQVTLLASLGCFLLLATQAAFLSPAKLGMMKELVGSRRLGSASGTLQLTNFMGILGGMGIAGWWFAKRLETGLNPWDAAWLPLIVVSVGSITQIFGALMIQRTPDHPNLTFHRGIWLQHFGHLKLIFRNRGLKLAAIGITYFWFVSNAVGSILVTLSDEMFPMDAAMAAKAKSMMPAMLGIGVMVGSLVAGFICRRRIELGLVPFSGFLLATTLFWSGIAPVSPWIYFAMIGAGIAGGAFMTPLYAYIQDQAHPDERARVMSALNLMDSTGSVIANAVLVKGMHALGLPSSWQLLALVPIMLAATVYMVKLLPRPLLMLVATAIARVLYKLKAHYKERTPKEGAVLLLPNHMSYADALMLSVNCDRPIRFVMLESFYKMKSIQWGLKLFGSVPISPTKAKEAIRTVADALKQQEAVVLFPEGQITRTGFLNRIHKGYELMARMGDDAKVQPVWMDGLWGSIFSFEGGRFFKKLPKALPYRVTVWFGEPMEAREASPERVQEAMLALSAEAFASREIVKNIPSLRKPDGQPLSQEAAATAHVNALRVLDTTLLHEDDHILCLLPASHPAAQTFGMAIPALRKLSCYWDITQVPSALNGRLIIIQEAATSLTIPPSAAIDPDKTVPLTFLTPLQATTEDLAAIPYPSLYDPATGTLLTISVPDPLLPEVDKGAQVGHKPGSAGHVLPGLAAKRATVSDAVILSGFLHGIESILTIPHLRLDIDGFLAPEPTSAAGTVA